MSRTTHKKPRPALDGAGLERLALFYAERYATSRAKLRAYLARKLAERGWCGEGAPPIDSLVERFAALGYVDDRAFAEARAAALMRRGYGGRRVGQALRAAGIEEEDAEPVRAQAASQAWASAVCFARRKRFGPFAPEPPPPEARRKAMGSMLRAGHDMDHVRRILNTSPEQIPDLDDW